MCTHVSVSFLRRAWVSAGGYTWVSSVLYHKPGGDGRSGCSAVRDKVLSKSQAGHETIHPVLRQSSGDFFHVGLKHTRTRSSRWPLIYGQHVTAAMMSVNVWLINWACIYYLMNRVVSDWLKGGHGCKSHQLSVDTELDLQTVLVCTEPTCLSDPTMSPLIFPAST